jgi:hypothetical protein
MFLAFLKWAVKAALHEAVEEFAEEIGVPNEEITRLRAARLEARDRSTALLDREAARELIHGPRPMPAANQVTAPDGTITEVPACPTPDQVRVAFEMAKERYGLGSVEAQAAEGPPEEGRLLVEWAENAKSAGVTWSEIGRLANAAGHEISVEGLRTRVRRSKQ